MSRFPTFLACFLGAAVVFGLSGCGDKTTTDKTNGKTPSADAGLAKLSPVDRAAAEKQKFCPVSNKPLGGKMGTPIKFTIEETEFFLCCDGCKSTAKKEPDRILANVKKLTANK